MLPLSPNLPTPHTLLSRLVRGEASCLGWSGGREGVQAWEGPGGGPRSAPDLSAPEATAGPPTCSSSFVGRHHLPLPVCTGPPDPAGLPLLLRWGEPRLPKHRCFRLNLSPPFPTLSPRLNVAAASTRRPAEEPAPLRHFGPLATPLASTPPWGSAAFLCICPTAAVAGQGRAASPVTFTEDPSGRHARVLEEGACPRAAVWSRGRLGRRPPGEMEALGFYSKLYFRTVSGSQSHCHPQVPVSPLPPPVPRSHTPAVRNLRPS